ncbi:MAG: (2Fe-2S) ferredoxin domain-containing protein [Clostridia bacterium]|nr:(2Fe-2S) ferredoxin domain-containing protein [Clostridia bacterium]MBQ4543809.1 (2Fe-2S) ferredoxin domain-containing protein [Clostridia bacterium]
MKSLAELEAIRNKTINSMNIRKDGESGIRIVVGMATCGIAAGARDTLNAISEELAKRNVAHASVSQTGCIGMCRLEPIVEVLEPGKDKVTYVKVDREKAVRIVNEHIINNKPVVEYTIGAVEK